MPVYMGISVPICHIRLHDIVTQEEVMCIFEMIWHSSSVSCTHDQTFINNQQ